MQIPEKTAFDGSKINKERKDMMCTLTFQAKAGENMKVSFLRLEEGEIENGEWKPERILNGDEQMSLKLGDMPGCLYVELYQY